MEFYGDYCGFTFNGVHTTALGIVRVSDGSRYDETMIPSFQDRTIAIPGADGSYYFDSTYNQRVFNLNLAFDNMSETQMRRFRQVFNGKSVGELIFDEAPYKAYTAKVQAAPQMKYVCFSRTELHQSTDLYAPDTVYTDGVVYKGEASISFVCYYPYARSVYKWLSFYTNENIAEWSKASGMLGSPRALSEDEPFDKAGESKPIKLYNPGDLDTDWVAFYKFENGANPLQKISLFTYEDPFDTNGTATIIEDTHSCLIFKSGGIQRPQDSADTYFAINSKTQLIEGYTGQIFVDGFQRSGTIYNGFIQEGDFFKIPRGITYFGSYDSNVIIAKRDDLDVENRVVPCISLRYDYLYY